MSHNPFTRPQTVKLLACSASLVLSLNACATPSIFNDATNNNAFLESSTGFWSSADQTANSPQANGASAKYNPNEDPNYLLLLGETAAIKQDYATAIQLYNKAAKLSNDLDIAKRALDLADRHGTAEQAAQAALHLLQIESDSEDALQVGIIYYLRNKQSDQAIDLAERYLLLETDTETSTGPIGARMLQIGSWLAQEKINTAHLEFTLQLAQKYPNLAETHFVYGVELLRAGDASEAQLSSETAMRLRPGWDRARVLQAQAVEAKGDIEGAKELYAKGIERTPSATPLRLEYAALLARTDNLAAAERQYETILGYDAEQPQALAALGRIAIERGNIKKAREYFLQLTNNAQFADRSAIWLAQIAESKGDLREAVNWYARVRGPEALTALSQVGRIMYQQGAHQQANIHFDRVREAFPNDHETLYLMQATYADQYQSAESSIDLLTKALEKLPKNTELLMARGLAFEKAGNNKRAWDDWETITEIEPNNAQAWNAWGYSLTVSDGDLDDAESYIDKALSIEPTSSAILDSKGWVLFKQDKYQEALGYLEKSWADFKHSEVAAHLGETLWQLNRKNEALTVWRAGAELSDDKKVLTETLQRLQQMDILAPSNRSITQPLPPTVPANPNNSPSENIAPEQTLPENVI